MRAAAERGSSETRTAALEPAADESMELECFGTGQEVECVLRERGGGAPASGGYQAVAVTAAASEAAGPSLPAAHPHTPPRRHTLGRCVCV